MKKLITGIALGMLMLTLPSHAAATGPTVEVTFVLDTTQSMRELIEGAKQKIWTIVRHMNSGRPTPTIRLGLIGYRDRGDEYVTVPYDLTDDIDLIYGHLIEFKALGGGDMPESVKVIDLGLARRERSGREIRRPEAAGGRHRDRAVDARAL